LADANDPLRRAKVERILVVVWVSFSLSVVISAVSLVVKGGVVLTVLRRRRSSLQTLGRAQSYGRALAVKIEDTENTLKEVLRSIFGCVPQPPSHRAATRERCFLRHSQVYVNIALAIFEDVPMACIGLYYLPVTYGIPVFQAVSLLTSGLLLGMKIASASTLPYRWGKVRKWRRFCPPQTDAHELGAELGPRDAGRELSKTEFTEQLGQLGASAGALACKRVVGITNLAEFQLELRKFQHRVAMLTDEMTDAAPAAPMATVLPNLDDADPEPPVEERVGNNGDLADRLAREQAARRRQQQGDVAIA
jgi:hypothetical protein